MCALRYIRSFEKLGHSLLPQTCTSSLSATFQISSRVLFQAFQGQSFHTSSFECRKMDTHKYPPYKHPGNTNNRWVPWPNYYEGEYTIKKKLVVKTGGRGPNGRIWVHRKGGEGRRYFRMIDFVRGAAPDGGVLIEKVEKVRYCPIRTAHIALVGSGERLRWIIASHGMKAGDLIKSSTKITKDIVKVNEGDAYPLGVLPLGTFVHCVQQVPGEGGRVATAAGTSALIVKKMGDQVIVRMPSKREMCVSNQCQATVGQVSNVGRIKIKLRKAGQNRWRGIRPKSGRWHRKTGRFGRKIRAIKPMVMCEKRKPQKSKVVKVTMLKQRLFAEPPRNF